jgi:tetratricopeptide (TPR) repeat protein
VQSGIGGRLGPIDKRGPLIERFVSWHLVATGIAVKTLFPKECGPMSIFRLPGVFGLVVVSALLGGPNGALGADFTCKYGSDVDEVIRECTVLIDRNSGSRSERADYFRSRFHAYREKRECDKAQADLDRSIALSSATDIHSLLARGLFAESCTGQLDEALAVAEEAIRRFPEENAPYLNRGNVLRMQGRYDAAAETLTRGIAAFRSFMSKRERKASQGEKQSNNRTLSQIYNSRGLVWTDAQSFEKALTDFNTAVAVSADNSLAIANRGRLWRIRGDLDRSLADLDKAISIEPKSALYFSYRSDTFRYAGNLERALADANLAISNAPDFVRAFVVRGLAYERQGKMDEARSDFEKAMNFNNYAYDTSRGAQETALARLAALNSGEAPPSIPFAPRKSESPSSIPTPALAVPAFDKPAAQERVKSTKASQGRRVALVIGNAKYKNVAALGNPQKDADAVAALLRNIGFDSVTLAADEDRAKLISSLRDFATEADKADWAMVYYAGHGIEVNGQNYLIPVDATLKTDRDVQFEAVPIDQVMAAIDGAKKLKLIVLDACRDNPFAPKMEKTGVREVVAAASTAGAKVGTRSIGRGLGEVKVAGASLVVFAAKHGQTALDGEGANSPFAVALVQRIATPGVEINKIFRLVRDDVMEATAGRQEPYTYGSLPGKEDFFFVATK